MSASASAVQTVLLAFLHPPIARQKHLVAQDFGQLGIVDLQVKRRLVVDDDEEKVGLGRFK